MRHNDAEINLDLIERMGGQLAKSGFWSDSRKPEEAIAKILVARDLGIAPTRALSDIHIVKGRPVIGYAVLGSLVKRSGKYRYRTVLHNTEACQLEWLEAVDGKWEVIGTSGFTIEEAKRAGLLSNPSWKSYPEDMLFARALTRGVRRHAPDVVGGAVYAPGELEEEPETLNVTPARPRALPAPAEPLSSPDEVEWNAAYAFLRMVFEEAVGSGKLQKGDGDVVEAAICRKLKVPAITEATAAQISEQTSQFLAFLEGDESEVQARLDKMRAAHAASKTTGRATR